MTRVAHRLLCVLLCSFGITVALGHRSGSAYADELTEQRWKVGTAKVDITPDVPLRLSGYAARGSDFTAIADRLYARALVLVPDQEGGAPLVLVSIDAIGISAVLTEHIVADTATKLGIPRSRIVLCTTHSHTAPHLDGVITNLFGVPIEGEPWAETMRYTQSFREKVTQVILQAAGTLQSGSVRYGLGTCGFAINRRQVKGTEWIAFGTVSNGPVDRTVRVLSVNDSRGEPLAIAYQYACHCTSISPEDNRVSADWAGISAAHLEDAFPGCIALPIIGCGADANPNPRGTLEHAQSHGRALADSVTAVLRSEELKELPYPTQTSFTLVALASERPSPQRLSEMQQSASHFERNFANHWLGVLQHKDRIPESYPAPIHLWTFGDALAWVFMSGEVVVDYQMRFERELSQFGNVWVAGYVDDVFAYVASERIRTEGGYESEGAMLYYMQPGRWASGTENAIVDRVLQMTRQKRLADEPMSAEESLASIQVPDGWTIELMASEPMVMDPINMAFGPDGSVWVVEMGDYPSGGPHSGRIKVLRDRDGDGKLDSSQVFLDGLNYPAGVYPWRDGIVVACAPDVFFARDTDGDGVADERKTLLTGFPEGNPQHRVHGFTYGLDHRLYFGTGGGADKILATGDGVALKTYPVMHSVAGFDLSLDPDTATLRLETGSSQYIRSTDDFANWFGNENSLPFFHFVVDQRWANYGGQAPFRRTQLMTDPPSIPPVYPISQQSDRFNDLYAVNRFTSACSELINRGPGQGESMRGWGLVCEPVHNLVVRFPLAVDGATWTARRAPEDTQSDWVRSSDPWFRPVRIENAPDGTLWIADMYRYVIEHPEWIPEEWQRRMNVRAGDDKGRIYRVRRKEFEPLPWRGLAQMDDDQALRFLASPSSAQADLAQQLLIFRNLQQPTTRTIAALRKLARDYPEARTRVRAFATLIAMRQAKDQDFIDRLADSDPRVAEVAVRWIGSAIDQDALRRSLWDHVRPESVAASSSLAIAMILESSPARQEKWNSIANALVHHANDPWVLELTSLIAPNAIDPIVMAVAEERQDPTDALGRQKVLEVLIPRSSEGVRNRLLEQIAMTKGQRPAWHYVLARQFAAAEAQGLDARVLQRVAEDANRVLRDADSDPGVAAMALDLVVSRLAGTWSTDHVALLSILKEQRSPNWDGKLALALANVDQSFSPLADAWEQWSPSAKASMLNHWVSQPATAKALVDRLVTGSISKDDVDALTIQRLRGLEEERDAQRVAELFGPAPGADRARIVADALQKWPTRPDSELGKAAYTKHCAVCHDPRTVDGKHQESVGPNLRGLAHWTNEAWITAVLDPHRSVEEKYWVFQARTEDGEAITGLKLREDGDVIEWVNGVGRIERTEKSTLSDLKISKQSLMPEGFEQLVAPEVLAGIVTYLRAESQ